MYDPEDHDLYLTPKIAYFSSVKGGASRHMLVNGSDQQIAVKIKCSNNSLYRVSPVYCNLVPGQAQRLQIVRDPGAAKVDKLIILFKRSDAINPRDAFVLTNDEESESVQKRLIALISQEDVAVQQAPRTSLKTILQKNSVA
ncbi:unnamed protein product, partial [Mesorhabditis spiculigera]